MKIFKNMRKIDYTFLLMYLILGLGIFLVLLKTYSEYTSTTVKIWDGETIASSFKAGNGSKDNPYVIADCEEFAYFKSLIDGTQGDAYKDKYYMLSNSIDLGNNPWEPIGNETNIFEGNFDGNGFTIKNAKITSSKVIENVENYGIFAQTKSATFKNINIENVTVDPAENNTAINVGALIGTTIPSDTGKLANLSLNEIYFNLNKIQDNENNNIGSLTGKITSNITTYSIFISSHISTEIVNNIGIISNKIESDANNIIIFENDTNNKIKPFNNDIENLEIKNIIIGKKSEDKVIFTIDNNEISTDLILKEINDNISTSLKWEFNNNVFSIVPKIVKKVSSPMKVSGVMNAAIAYHSTSEVSGETLYVNDLQADYYDYMGKNYTDHRADGVFPTMTSQNIYNDSTLAQVYIKYDGSDISNSSLSGYIGPDDHIKDIIYYKYYPVKDGYIEFELIDNPYGVRPNDKAFNGWVTDYSGAVVTLDVDNYVRKVKIPAPSNLSNPISITFNASWTVANTYILGENSLSNAASSLSGYSMKSFNMTPNYEDMRDYYFQAGSRISRNNSYPTNAYDTDGSYVGGQTCTTSRHGWSGLLLTGGCTYYTKVEDIAYDSSKTYYKLSNSAFSTYVPPVLSYNEDPNLPFGSSAAGYYTSVSLTNGQSRSGYYDANGQYYTSGTCNSTRGCTYYVLHNYYNSSNSIDTVNNQNLYYYLITRDTNIVVMNQSKTGNISISKPMTLTSINNGADYRSSAEWTYSGEFSINADVAIQYLRLKSDTNKSTSAFNGLANSNLLNSEYVTGNYYNVKFGRGITSSTSNKVTAFAILGGANAGIIGVGLIGSADNPEKYRLIVESGVYNGLSVLNGASLYTAYVDASAIYGNDLDRVRNDNSKLTIVHCAAGTWGSTVYGHSDTTGVAISTVSKSGQFGTGKLAYSSGIYSGGRMYDTLNSATELTIEGGYYYNVVGSYGDASGRENKNTTYINQKGGTVDFFVGGAGETSTNGSRIINVTGGTINYSIFGGSNSYETTIGGNLNGSTFIYIGGNAIIGGENETNNGSTLFKAEAGSVFGAGNGYSERYKQVGAVYDTNIIIDQQALIRGNVYGGGNTGVVGYSKASNTNIKILGGTINGNVYGGANKNDSGTTDYESNSYITMENGLVKGSIYGGSKSQGIVYGSSNININGGQVNTDVYGGGEGSSTFIQKNSNVVIGNSSNQNTLTIKGSVYGGSAYGTVNTNSTSATEVSTYGTNVTVNRGNINGAVYGGAKGDSSNTPIVQGNVVVTTNGGNIGYVYGANNASGMPSGTINVYLKGGIIGNAFAGGNNVGANNPNIYLQGATVTNLFGGSNSNGNVPISTVTIESGTASYVYGGNNVGGKTTTTNIYLNGGNVTSSVFGGGKQTSSDTTNITLQGGNVNNIFGGSDTSGDVITSTIFATSGTAQNIYGGNNAGGVTTTANVNINGASVTNAVYGGGNLTTTTNSIVTVQSTGNAIPYVYGGGNSAAVTIPQVTITGGTIVNAFGGSNTSGNINQTSITVQNGSVTNAFGGNNAGGTVTTSDLQITGGTVGNTYGGNNAGGTTTNAHTSITGGTITNDVYGGGYQATSGNTVVSVTGGTINNDVYGGGNRAAVSSGTDVDIVGVQIKGNVYGGGNTGSVGTNTDVYLHGGTIGKSVYAGGNGSAAIVNGNTLLNIDNGTVIGKNVFGGGNAAVVGSSSNNNSTTNINIVGATINGNVYGGANTSVLYGTSYVKIGKNAVNNDNLTTSDIHISGTVFGGGEANASGSEEYDFSHIGVTNGTNVLIDASDHVIYLIDGSIFGSGNASSSEGTSIINIKNYGTFNYPKNNISIQRANNVIIDNSSILLTGATDRTNEYKSTLFSLSRLDEIKLKNNSNLYLKNGTNLVKKFKSVAVVNNEETKATVTIDPETFAVTKNVDNRIYAYQGVNINIAQNENVTSYGEVSGMTFFGLFTINSNNVINTAMFNPSVQTNSTISQEDKNHFSRGSYVLGSHMLNHDITVDGFYSNYTYEESPTTVYQDYIVPTPEDQSYYMWYVGEPVKTYELTLTASKFSTLGTQELNMYNHKRPNTTYRIIGFNYDDLDPNITLVDPNTISKIAPTEQEADTKFGLTIKTSKNGWLNIGRTDFYNRPNNSIVGTMDYVHENTTNIPNLLFYFYHSKNISSTAELGKVTISFIAITKIDALNNDIERVDVDVILNRALYSNNDYEGTVTPGKEYEMFTTSQVNITSTSTFSAYYGLFSLSNKTIYDEGYHHTLVSTYAFPENTKITMVDLGNGPNPEYYYYIVTAEDVTRTTTEYSSSGEATYELSKFIKMGSTDQNSNYDEASHQAIYYKTDEKYAEEEFIFMLDFLESNITSDVSGKLTLELRDEDDQTIVNVLGNIQDQLTFNLNYDKDSHMTIDGSIDKEAIYGGESVNLNAVIDFVQPTGNSAIVQDTNFFNNKMGLKVTIYDSNNNLLNATDLIGVSFIYDGITYYPSADGATRIKIADQIASASAYIKVKVNEGSIASGNYRFRLEAFASPDGKYYGLTPLSSKDLNIRIANMLYGLKVTTDDKNIILDKDTGFNLSGNNSNLYNIAYDSHLSNPGITMSIERRLYDDVYSLEYEKLDLADFVTNSLTAVTVTDNEYLLTQQPTATMSQYLHFKENLPTGTYRIMFNLYDGPTYIDSDFKYLIIK